MTATIRLKVVRKNVLKMKEVTRLPADLRGDQFITVVRDGIAYTIGADYTKLSADPLLGSATSFVAVFDQAAGYYKIVGLPDLFTTALGPDLQAIEALTGAGIAVRTGVNTWALRNVVGGFAVTVTNGDGVSGNISVAVTDPELVALAGLVSAADKLPYFTGPGTAALTDFSTFGRSLVDDANAAAARATLGSTTVGDAVFIAANAAAARTAIGTVIGTDVQAYDSDLAALAANAGTGLWAVTGSGSGAVRTIVAPAAGITITNPGGVAGNPTMALANDLAAVEGLAGTGIAVRSAADTWVQRSIAGTANQITVTNGDGASGNPTVGLATNAALPGSPTTTTQSPSDNSTKIATTAYVDAQVAGGVAGVASYNTRTGAVETTVADIGAGIRMINGSISESRTGGAATYAILSQAGNTPNNAADKVKIPFTSAAGGMVLRNVTSGLTITIPSSTTLGSVSGLTSPLYVYSIDNAGTSEMALSLKHFGDFGTVTTVAISGGASSTTMYSTTARSNVRFTLIGVSYFSQTTAGTWASAPSSIQLAPFVPKKYGFRYGLTGNQAVAQSTFVKVQLNTMVYDDDSVWVGGSFRMVCQEPGRYDIRMSAASLSGNLYNVYGYKNGSEFMSTSGTGAAGLSSWIDLIPGDYIELHFFIPTSGQSVYGVPSSTWLGGMIVR